MFKILDKFILSRFIGPFILAYCVVTFIFLIQHLIRYFAYFVGKGIELIVFAELFSHFALMLTPVALPLAVLLSSLMSFGGLGEHSELTAIKSSGVSLLRMLRPIALFSFLLTLGAVYFNDVISPQANLNAYSLLYDIKQKKPTLDLKESAFYSGLPGYSIWIDGKEGEDGQELKGIKIYNHTSRQGNSDLIMADRGRMYMTPDNNNLVLELIDGARFTNLSAERGRPYEQEFLETGFDSSRLVFSMESFNLKQTEKDLFKGHNMMKTSRQLLAERDSLILQEGEIFAEIPQRMKAYTMFHFAKELDSIVAATSATANLDAPPPMLPENTGTAVATLPLPDTVNKRPKPSIILSEPRDIPIIDDFLGRRGLPSFDDLSGQELIEARAKRDSLAKQTSPLQLPQRTKQETDTIPATATATQQSKPAQDTVPAMTSADVRQVRQQGSNVINVNISPENASGGIVAVQTVNPIPKHWRSNRNYRELNMAWSKANGMKIAIEDIKRRGERQQEAINKYEVELHNKYSRSAAVFIMFLIGAPLGAIIKKGGLGLPILISILFFIIYYITTITGTKLASSMIVPPVVGCWGGDVLLLACGLFFLRQAYTDSRLFDADYYLIMWDNVKEWAEKWRKKKNAVSND